MIEGPHNQEINLKVRKLVLGVGLKYGQQEATKTLNMVVKKKDKLLVTLSLKEDTISSLLHESWMH